MSFGNNLQFMRRMHNGMTQEELAEKMGVSRQTISKWEMDTSFPEMEKAVVLSEIFNCSLDEMFKDNMNSLDNAYSNIRIEKKSSFRYFRYAVVSNQPEDDAMSHVLDIAKKLDICNPEIVGWDFPFVSQEQINVFHMHGYCAACIIDDDKQIVCNELMTQPGLAYAAITIENPSENPFSLIPNAYKTLLRYIEVNGYKENKAQDIINCFEKEYEKNGRSYMDVYITLMPDTY